MKNGNLGIQNLNKLPIILTNRHLDQDAKTTATSNNQLTAKTLLLFNVRNTVHTPNCYKREACNECKNSELRNGSGMAE